MHHTKSHMNIYPNNWTLIEEYDGNYIFENSDKSFCVNVDYTSNCEYCYIIYFLQLRGQKTEIGFENDAYITHAKVLEDAYQKTIEMMEFINLKTT